MDEIIERIYATGEVVGRSGQIHKVHSAIDRKEGDFLYKTVRDDGQIKRTLEVGCAYGLSSLFICSALKDRPGAHHTIIDPFQISDWDSAGILNLEKSGCDSFTLIEERSEFALPKLLFESEETFDFVFIDGWHTFDQTMLDCYFALRLLRVGGLLVVDDVEFESVRRVVAYLRCYPSIQFAGSVERARRDLLSRVANLAGSLFGRSERRGPKWLKRSRDTMVALRKIGKDERNWDWHENKF
jgi:predicted O-methyltransferase YrrM